MAVAVALAGAGLAFWSPALLAMGMVVAATGLVSRAWAAAALKGVTYRRRLTPRRAFPGEKVVFEVEVSNDKLLPVAWLRVADTVPAAVEIQGARLGPSTRPRARTLLRWLSLLPYEKVRSRHVVKGPRGLHIFGPAQLESGDVFGLYSVGEEHSDVDRLIVYPRWRPLASMGFPPGQPLLGTRTPRSLSRDPLRPVGVREYRPRDSRRRVHWKATARTGELRVKVEERVARSALVVLLNAATFRRPWIGVNPERQEAAISVAASVAADAIGRRRQVGLIANSTVRARGRPIRVPPGRRQSHLRRILEALAAVSSFITQPVERLVAVESRRAPWGASLVVVTPVVTPALVAELMRVRRAGRLVSLVSLDPEPPALPAALDVRTVPVAAVGAEGSA